MVLFIGYASAPRVSELRPTPGGEFVEAESRPDLASVPGLLVVRPEGGLFFGNANRVRHAVSDLVAAGDSRPQVVCLVLTASYRLGVPVLDALSQLEEDLRRDGTELWLARVPRSARTQLEQDALGTRLAPDRIWPTVRAAAEHFTLRG